MEKKNDSLPGITLKIVSQEITRSAITRRKVARLEVEVDIVDDAVWAAAEQKLSEGFKVYTVDDFKTEMMRTLREENQRLEGERHDMLGEQSRLKTQNADLQSSLTALIARERVVK